MPMAMHRIAIALLLLAAAAAHADQRLGTIAFANSGKSEAQAAFLRGVALLHNFAYPQAAKAYPEHPGVLHYLIHAYDDPVHAPLGLRAARRYAKVASDAPHALHMPSHIFLQLGMWDEAAHSNEAAYALSKQWSEPDYHSLEWLEYVYLQQGRFADAKKLIDDAKGDGERAHHAGANMRARYAIESGDWDGFDFAGGHDAASIFARGLQAVAHRNLDDARRAAAELKPMDEKAARPMEDELA